MFKEFDPISYMLHPHFPGEGIDSYTEAQGDNWRMAWRRYYHVSDEDIEFEEENTLKGILVNGLVAPLDRFFIPVKVEGKGIEYHLFTDLTFYANDMVTFLSKLPDWKGIKQGKEVIIEGDPIVIEGKMVLKQLDTHIPILVNCDPRQVPYTDLTFL